MAQLPVDVCKAMHNFIGDKDFRALVDPRRMFVLRHMAGSVINPLCEFLRCAGYMLTEDMCEQIELRDTRTSKIGKILDLLQCRGPSAYAYFITALIEFNQIEVLKHFPNYQACIDKYNQIMKQ